MKLSKQKLFNFTEEDLHFLSVVREINNLPSDIATIRLALRKVAEIMTLSPVKDIKEEEIAPDDITPDVIEYNGY
jgi:hypothetical protein